MLIGRLYVLRLKRLLWQNGNVVKSKIREIQVDSQTYIWRVIEIDWETVLLKVWIKGQKKAPWFSVKKQFDDPWINFSEFANGMLKSDHESSAPITPGLVAAYIRDVKRQDCDIGGGTLAFQATQDGLVVVDEKEPPANS